MTPTQTDLKNAKEFITQLARSENDPLDQDEVNALTAVCAAYLLHEVAAGRVKFTANREGV